MAKIPVVTEVELATTILGKYVAIHACPHCQDRLKSREYEIGKPDECPDCGGAFAVSKQTLQQIDNEKIRSQKEKTRKARKRNRRKKKRPRVHEKQRNRVGGVALFVCVATVFYALSPPFVLSFVFHMSDWFGIDSWFGIGSLELLGYVYSPLESLTESSPAIDEFYQWYIWELFPDWFLGSGFPVPIQSR